MERRDWTSRWEGREVLGLGSLIGGGRRADMRLLLLWPPIGATAGVAFLTPPSVPGEGCFRDAWGL